MNFWTAVVTIKSYNEDQINKALYSCILQSVSKKKIIILVEKKIYKNVEQYVSLYFRDLIKVDFFEYSEEYSKVLKSALNQIKSKYFSILPWGQLFYPDLIVLINSLEKAKIKWGTGQYVISKLKDYEYIESKVKSSYTEYDLKFKILFNEDFIESQFIFSSEVLSNIEFDSDLLEFYFYKFLIDLISEFDYIFIDLPICEKIHNFSGNPKNNEKYKVIDYLYSKQINLVGKEIHKIHSLWDSYYRLKNHEKNL